jgi:putative two-component system response regulator
VNVTPAMPRERSAAESVNDLGRGTIDALELAGVLGAMDLIVLRRIFGKDFLLMTAPGDWFHALSKEPITVGGTIRFEGKSDYLDNFLVDASKFWAHGKPGRIHSGTWLETDAIGNSWPLEAQALSRNGDAFLIIEHQAEAYAEKVQLLQVARNHLLNEEMLEREVQRRTAAIRQREEEIAIRLLAAAGSRDEETGSHVRRIGLFSAAIGIQLGWDHSRAADIRLAAPMHDIGKIGVPDSILLKPGRLTDEEYRLMQRHTVIGANMLGNSDIPILAMAREIALCHHEKWDGSGYPNGLKGEEIPVAARIVAIVDVYDAMVHRRVYKAPIPEVEVLDAMAQAAGNHFDPMLFEVFRSVLPMIRQIRDAVPEQDETLNR